MLPRMTDDAPASSPEALVATAVDVFLRHPGQGQDAILDGLAQEGVPPESGWLLYQLVPTAFCRVALRHTGITFPDIYLAQHPDTGARVTRAFTDEPLYVAAVQEATARIAGGLVRGALLPIVAHSAEFDAINKLAKSGSKLSDIVLVEPILFEYTE